MPVPPEIVVLIEPLHEPKQVGFVGVNVAVIGGGDAIEVVAVIAQPFASVTVQV